MKYLFSLFFVSCSFTAFSQITIGGNNPDDFVAQALASHNTSISNVTYTGFDGAVCYFSANVQNMPFTSGLLMTTGATTSAVGPNNSDKTSVVNNRPGYSPLDGILGATSYDAAVISFDIIPDGNSLKIRYIFASEEYSEYVGSPYTDGMAIYISGPGITGIQNIARLPNGDPITVNKINNGTVDPEPGVIPIGAVNASYFVNNGNGGEAPYNSSNTYLQFDGLTVPLTAESAVIAGEIYHIVIAIADAGDRLMDSGVFIEESGITASLGENDLSENVRIVFNPDNQHATIEVKDQQQLSYTISDLSGKILAQSRITASVSVDLSAYASGMYLVSVTSTNGTLSKKIMR